MAVKTNPFFENLREKEIERQKGRDRGRKIGIEREREERMKT